MSDIGAAANLADVIRVHARSRGDATAFEFEGRRTSCAIPIGRAKTGR